MRNVTRSFIALLVFAVAQPAVPAPAPASESAKEPTFESRFEGMRFRNIGPFRGGRVTAVVGVRGQRNVAYQGATGGGVWKTTDGGTSWEAVSGFENRLKLRLPEDPGGRPEVLKCGSGLHHEALVLCYV